MMFLIMIPFNFNYINATTYEQARYEVKNIEYACACRLLACLAVIILYSMLMKKRRRKEREVRFLHANFKLKSADVKTSPHEYLQ